MIQIEASPQAAPESRRTPEVCPQSGVSRGATAGNSEAQFHLPQGLACGIVANLTPSLARAILAILFAPVIALLKRRMAAALADLTTLLEQWRDGTLPPAPPARARRSRSPAARPHGPAAPPPPSWLEALFDLASSDQAPPIRHPDGSGHPRVRVTNSITPRSRTASARRASPRPCHWWRGPCPRMTPCSANP